MDSRLLSPEQMEYTIGGRTVNVWPFLRLLERHEPAALARALSRLAHVAQAAGLIENGEYAAAVAVMRAASDSVKPLKEFVQ